MKRILAAALLTSFAVATTNAQEIPQRKHEGPARHKTEIQQKQFKKQQHDQFMKLLNLTAEQKEQFKAQREEFKKKMDELKKIDNITVKEWKGRMETLRIEHKTKMENIFTKEQKEKMAIMKESREKMEKVKGETRMKMMKVNLGLTAEQSVKLDKHHAALQEKMKAIREDKNLSDEQKKEKAKELHKKQQEELKTILTEEQLQKMKENLKMHRKGPGGKEGPGGPGKMQRQKPQAKETI